MSKNNPSLIESVFAILVIVGFTALIIFWAISTLKDSAYNYNCRRYVMPDGTRCIWSDIKGGSYGGATHEFSSCDNGLAYINPETFDVVDICK